MIEKIIEDIVNSLVINNIISREQKEEYQYALICEIESLIIIGSVLIIASICQRLFSTVCFLWFFLKLRKRVGGYHLNSFMECYLGSICMYGLVVCLCSMSNSHMFYLNLLGVIACLYITIVGTVNHPNIHMNFVELKNTKILARRTLILELIIIKILKYMEVDVDIINYSLMGIIMCALLLFIAKMLGQEVKENG